ncbi:MAG: hypothetical protein H6Q73_2144 [Firmicutes bacterium]|nr:hypothetical protein [Bacillota bacterium]
MRELKDSGIAWIGDIPNEWSIQRVKHAFTRKIEKAMQENPVVLSLARSGVRIRDISTNEGQVAESYFNYNPVDVDDLLLNPMDLYSGANCSISKVVGVISPAYINLRSENGINPTFYDYYFKVQYWMMAFFAHGKGVSFENRWTLNTETIMNYPIVSLPYTEQCRIADYLDVKCAKIDSMVEKQQQVIEKLTAYKLSVITEAVTKGLNLDAPMKDSNVKWIGAIPQNWRLSHIGNLAEMGSGGTPDRQKIEYWTEGTIPWMASGEINYEYVYETNEKITELGMQNSNAKLLPVNTVMLGLIGQGKTKGLTAILKIESTCNQNLAYLIPSPKLLHHSYLFYCFKAMYYYVRGLVGDSQAGIYLYFLKKLYIPLPEVDEQFSIAKSLDNKCAKIDIVITKKQALIDKLIEYKKSLIYEAVTGKLEV